MPDHSFAAKAKSELCRKTPARDCCAAAELYGALLFANTFSYDELRLVTENERFRERFLMLAKRVADAVPEVRVQSGKSLITASGETARKLYTYFGYEQRGETLHLNNAFVENDCCREAFFRGVFLSAGSVSDPERSYHLEPNAALAVHTALIEKELRNSVNRRVNCDTANISKTVSAAQKQLDAIRKLEAAGELEKLPEVLREAARLRIENPEEPLAALAEMAGVSRSGLNHRLARLCELAKNL